MKSLRPLVILIGGPLLLGVVGATVGSVYLREPQGLRIVSLYFAVAAAAGLICFGPIAAGLALRTHLTGRLARFAFRAQWIASIVMALCIGYIVGSVRQDGPDPWAVVAAVLVFLGGAVRIALETAYSTKSS